jgi:hypothetical protein
VLREVVVVVAASMIALMAGVEDLAELAVVVADRRLGRLVLLELQIQEAVEVVAELSQVPSKLLLAETEARALSLFAP